MYIYIRERESCCGDVGVCVVDRRISSLDGYWGLFWANGFGDGASRDCFQPWRLLSLLGISLKVGNLLGGKRLDGS